MQTQQLRQLNRILSLDLSLWELFLRLLIFSYPVVFLSILYYILSILFTLLEIVFMTYSNTLCFLPLTHIAILTLP